MSKNKTSEVKTEVKKKITLGRIILIVLLLGILGFATYTFLGMKESAPGRPGQAEEEQKETTFAVTTTEAVSGQIKDLLNVNGDVIPDSSVDFYSDISRKLIRLNVGLGDYVSKNQVIVEVDPSRPGMSYTASPVKATVSGTVTSMPFDIGATISPQVPVARIGNLTNLQV
jgi:membrane fusion protein (multidrug efflux system)